MFEYHILLHHTYLYIRRQVHIIHFHIYSSFMEFPSIKSRAYGGGFHTNLQLNLRKYSSNIHITYCIYYVSNVFIIYFYLVVF